MLAKIKTVICTLLFSSPLLAQQELGLNFMRHIWESNKTNPAVVQPNTFVLGILSVRNNLVFDGPTYNQMVSKQNGEPVIDIDRMVGYLKPQNDIRDDLEISTVSAALKLGDLTLSLGHAVKYHAFLKYPKTLPQVVWQGNAQFIGETVDLGNELQLTGYHEIAIGGAYDLGVLTLGAKAKFLSGIFDATTDDDHHSASLYTNPDVYQITLTGDYILHTANSIEYNSYKDLDADFGYGQLTLDRFISGNTGFAFDVGARLEVGKLDIAASLLDIGQIKWNHGVTNYEAIQAYEYDGLDFSEALTGGEDADFGNALDTLEALFKVEETTGSYTSQLPQKAYFSVLYNFNETLTFGGLLFYEVFRGETSTALAAGANVNVVKYLTIGGTYAIKENTYDNFGLNATVKLGPVRIFAVTDNILATFDPGDSKNYTGRVGANIVFK